MAIPHAKEIAYPCPHPSQHSVCLFLPFCPHGFAPAYSTVPLQLTSKVPDGSWLWRLLNLKYRLLASQGLVGAALFVDPRDPKHARQLPLWRPDRHPPSVLDPPPLTIPPIVPRDRRCDYLPSPQSRAPCPPTQSCELRPTPSASPSPQNLQSTSAGQSTRCIRA